MKQLAVLAVGAVLALSACGTESTDSAAASTPTPTPTVEVTATPAQFASIIAEHETAWRDYSDNITDCAFARIVGDTALDEMKVMSCGLTTSTVTLKAKTALKSIADLPSPDPEVAALVDRTVQALTPLSEIEASEVCMDQASEACGDMATLTNGAIRPVIPVLDAWSPYVK